MPRHDVIALAPITFDGGGETCRYLIDGREKSFALRLHGFHRSLCANLEDWHYDLLELAALAYAVDASVGRGKTTDPQMGRGWYREFHIRMPVREVARWTQLGLAEALTATLNFVSGDHWQFEFEPVDIPFNGSGWFHVEDASVWKADRIVMFSGGLDSFSGALHEIIDNNQRVALVSHFSSTKGLSVQKRLITEIRKAQGSTSCFHFPAQIQLGEGTNRETSHRTRSFLFAVLGFLAAQVFGRERVSFFENGVVSLNLPPVENVQSTRATRTTHPQTLALFTEFLSKAKGEPFRIDNPYFWHTKSDVVGEIERLNMGKLIGLTTSCADTRHRTVLHPHCGVCSQCIDRRFAVLDRKQNIHDPATDYEVDLLAGERKHVGQREIALAYVRNALAFEHIQPSVLEQRFPDVLSAVGYLGEAPHVALDRIAKMHRRHGAAVAQVLRDELRGMDIEALPSNSMSRMFGDLGATTNFSLPSVPSETTTATTRVLRIVLETKSQRVLIDGVGQIKPLSAANLVRRLADNHLDAMGNGLETFDFPCLRAPDLASRLGVESEEAVRKQVNRTRTELGKLLGSAGLDADTGRELIENHPWQGYRLRPEAVEVRRAP